ncbi:hypothetical protein [Ralstonia phage RSP15]|uniref:hypothetical protein n=1 Tax=Ralstonia phage RSP15 TaxID=1785960 RepID=UPI00074D47C2|nr:hypothetical protein BH754_gp016 [Ralstonia phage RSP15]BAU39974.1 hypothetical protein [Ralstonia phage RSP15]
MQEKIKKVGRGIWKFYDFVCLFVGHGVVAAVILSALLASCMDVTVEHHIEIQTEERSI